MRSARSMHSEVAEYMCDISGKRTELARCFGLLAAAEVLKRAQTATASK
jgi:hypothetical protein